MTVGAGRLGVPDGTAVAASGVREAKTGEQVFGSAHGKYYEAALRGNLFSAVNTTARAPTSALSTTTPITLYNPVGSGKLLSIKKVGFGQAATGTFGTGTQFHTIYTLSGPTASQGGTIPSGTAITILNALVGSPQASVAQAFENATLHTNNPAILWPFLDMSKVAGGTIGGNSMMNLEDVDGAIVLGPGSGWTPQGITSAVSSPLAWFSVVWEEIPIS